MNSHRRSLHHLWRQWEKLAFTSRMLWTIKQHRAVSAPEYDPTLEQDVLLESVPKTLPAIAKKVWLYWPGYLLPLPLTPVKFAVIIRIMRSTCLPLRRWDSGCRMCNLSLPI